MKPCYKISVLSATLLFSSLAFYSVPPKCEAVITPARIIQIAGVVAGPQDCAAGVMEQLCTSLTSFLNEEAAKADADAKACKKSCGWKKRKDDLLDAARKKAKESCSKGEAPDVNEISKGLDKNTKDRLKGLYDRNSRMFDGKAKLEAANFGAVPSKNTAITGKGGQVTDLKSAEPATPKLTAASEFSLSGTKSSSGNSGLSATKQPPVLLASASSATISTNTAFASSGKSALLAAGAATSTKTSASATAAVKSEWDYESCAACTNAQPGQCFGICCKEQPNQGWCQTYCGYGNQVLPPEHEDFPEGNAGYCNCCKQYNSNCYVPYYCPSGGGTGKPGFWTRVGNFFKGVYHYLKGDKQCGEGYYAPKKEFCVFGEKYQKCGGQEYNPGTEYCENNTKCEESCSAGVISAVPAPTNGEVILPVGGTATLSVSGEKGGTFEWSKSAGTLTPSADNKQATITNTAAGKVTVTFGSKACSKCRTSIIVAFVRVATFVPQPFITNAGKAITFTIETTPAGAPYLKLVRVNAKNLSAHPLPAGLVKGINESLEKGAGVYVYQSDKSAKDASFDLNATVGGGDKGVWTGVIQIYESVEWKNGNM